MGIRIFNSLPSEIKPLTSNLQQFRDLKNVLFYSLQDRKSRYNLITKANNMHYFSTLF